MPAVAMPGLPVGLIVASPVGEATTVGAPFITSTAPHSSAKRRAMSSRDSSSAAGVKPVNRPISPRCGVSTSGAHLRAASRRSARPANASSPSASSTTGDGDSATTRRASSADSAVRERPGPSATTCASRARATIMGAAPPASERSGVSGSGQVMASIIADSIASLTLSGTAAVTSPAPTRSADIEASTIAPVSPAEPPTTSTRPASPLCASTLRCGTSAAADSSGSHSSGAGSSSGSTPMSTTSIVPHSARPG